MKNLKKIVSKVAELNKEQVLINKMPNGAVNRLIGNFCDKSESVQKNYYAVSITPEANGIEDIIKNILFLNKILDNIHIVLADTLMRHYLQVDTKSEIEAHNEARSIGKKWEEAILMSWEAQNIDCSLKPLTIVHWDNWILDLCFQQDEKKIKSLYKYDNNFKIMIDHSCEIFIKRKNKQGKIYELNYSDEKVIKYCLEELTIFFNIIRSNHSTFIYNGSLPMFLKLKEIFQENSIRFINLKRHKSKIYK